VSVLFTDLVGFTTLSEHRDPEEIRELLSRYFERCRTLIERYGGTVEKFIGDAVMAVWGTPVAREDDAERAVRAALALVHAVTALGEEVGMPGLRARAGVLTGSAAVEIGAAGEGMVLGDTVNTASRLQSIARPGTVLVDDVTRRASEAAIAYEDAGAHQVKGREQPVHAWTALSVVAGAGGARRNVGLEAPFVGREAELDLIVEAAEDSAVRGVARLVTVVGDAGSGKSRLLWEFFKVVDGIEQVRFWHQGRCLSYGTGVAYWALAEMIRARAGIAEEEDPASAREKLRATVERFVADDRERGLVEPRLAHLLGLEQRTASEPADLFSGWRLFFERMAATNPVILVFEDLQWADSGLLDFVDYLLEWSADLPLFVLALGRPDLEARRPGWGATARLQPLPAAAMQRLLAGLVPGLPTHLATRILERAEGVPLYAVEIVRMLLDRGLIAQDGPRYVVTSEIADLEVPETLHALVAARLDNLDARERALLQDAAVLGQSFSAAAVAAVGGRAEADVRRALDGLVAKQVLGSLHDERLAESGQYHFLQALLRTIALGTLSRRDRKARHLAAAQHLRGAWAGESTEIAEVLASHYLEAVAAEPEAPDADAIRASARETLSAAGHRAASLALGSEARRYFEQAAGLADEQAERAGLLAEAGRAAERSADHEGARGLLGEAIEVLDACGETEDAARTRALLADVLIAENRLEEAAVLMDRARQALVDEDVIAELAARRARVAFLTADYTRALAEAETAARIADRRGLVAVLADAVMTKAVTYYYERRTTEAGALMALSLDLALEADVTEHALRGYFNVGEHRLSLGRIEEALTLLERGISLARERGNRSWERDLVAQTVQAFAHAGRWDDAIDRANRLREGGKDQAERQAWGQLPLVLAARGDAAGLEAWLARSLPATEWQEAALIEQLATGVSLRALGRTAEALPLLVDPARELVSLGHPSASHYVGEVLDATLEAGGAAALEELLSSGDEVVSSQPLFAGQLARGRARLQARQGEPDASMASYERAVRLLREGGSPFALAVALLEQGELLAGLGRGEEGDGLLREARSTFAELRATPWLERTDRALSAAAVV
jgi:class 3 adenylate cyclase/tetratricopeptide (TPR) repeat protein